MINEMRRFQLPLLLCLAIHVPAFSAEDPFGPIAAEVDVDQASEEDKAAWQEWVDAFAKAEEIEFFFGRVEAGKAGRKVADPQQLKAIATEVSESLEASPVEEFEELFEVRIKGFQPKKSAILWVSGVNEPGPDGLRGHVFMIGYQGEGDDPFTAVSVGTKKGKALPVLGKLISDACRAWSLKLSESPPVEE